MLLATVIFFVLALVIAIPLMIQAGLWSLPLAALCVIFGIFYTAGPKPLGYLGLGEILVLVFFGPVATVGTYFLQTSTLHPAVWIASLIPGCLSCAILIANNLRDERSDRIAHKNTLVARFGRTFGAIEYTVAILIASLIPLLLPLYSRIPTLVSLTSLISLGAVPLIRKVFSFKDPLELIFVLQGSALLLTLFTLSFCLTLFIGSPV